jgi:hypothetical protein
MKRFLVYAALLFTSLVAAGMPFSSAQVIQRTISEDNRTEEEIRAANVEEVQAFLHNDPKTMARLWSDDFVVTNPLTRIMHEALRGPKS